MRRSLKSVRKQCFFTFFETLCTKFAKNAKKTAFLSFLRDVRQKVWENSVFSRFSRHFVQSSQKCEKTVFFLSFLREVHQEVWENSVFRVFRENSVFLRKTFAKNAKRQRFLIFLNDVPRKMREKSFFSFFVTICAKLEWNARKQRFLSFLHDVSQKVWQNSVFFRVFWDTSYKVRKISEKTAFFELSALSSAKSVRKQCFF